MNESLSSNRARRLASIGAPRFASWLPRCVVTLGLGVVVVLSASCGGAQSNARAPQTSGASASSPDAGSRSPRPSRRGVIVPSDTGIGAMPTGTGSSIGTTGRGGTPALGNPGGGSN